MIATEERLISTVLQPWGEFVFVVCAFVYVRSCACVYVCVTVCMSVYVVCMCCASRFKLGLNKFVCVQAGLN
jgi:hypothetical protein